MTDDLIALEREVEQARFKLARDLAVLRSPTTFREFGADLKSQAQSGVQRIIDDLKARAVANPAATIAIAAGIGWRLVKHPPFSAALIGVGVLGLWRTQSLSGNGDYLRSAQRRFGEQVGDAAETVREYAAEAAIAAGQKIGEYADSAKEKLQEAGDSATEKTSEALDVAREAAAEIPDRASHAIQRARSEISRAVSEEHIRDQVLLTVAGLAVAAALGIASRRRLVGDDAF